MSSELDELDDLDGTDTTTFYNLLLYEIGLSNDDLQSQYDCDFNNCRKRFKFWEENKLNLSRELFPTFYKNDRKISSTVMQKTVNFMIKIVENENNEREQDELFSKARLKMNPVHKECEQGSFTFI